jgi:UPF0716 family protein affecting phage T7 exclusion
MKLITLTTLLIVCVAINIAALIWIGYNVNPILTLILVIGEVWAVASIIKSEPKDNNNQGKLNF